MTSSELQQQSKAKALAHLLTRENGFAVNVDDVISGQLMICRRCLGHVELVLADNGPLLVLRHLDPLADSDR